MDVDRELKLLLEYAGNYYNRGWMPATAGNLSVLDSNSGLIHITASGKNKGKLKKEDFVSVDRHTLKPAENTNNRPSAETSIHRAVYDSIESANAVLHVHTIASNTIKTGVVKNNSPVRVLLPNNEILKAFGDFREEPKFQVICTFNHGNVPDISADFLKALQEKPSDVPFFLIENHGITVWGRDVEDANKNLEAADFLLQVMARKL